MSKLSPLSLPRFDAKALARTTQARQAYPGTQDPQDEMIEAAEPIAGDAPQAPIGEEGAQDAPALPETPQIDTGVLLASLEKSLAEIEQTAIAVCHQAIGEFLMSAFPRLNEAFLAEEVATALQTLAPPNVAHLNVHVPAELKAAFQRTIEQSPRLAEICELHPHDNPEDICVDVDWSEGGVRFDMDQFLNSSLGRLSGLQTP